MNTQQDAVVVDRLTEQFGSRTVVDRISFNVPRGSVTGLIGPNGAGKTTIMGMLLGLVRPTSGTAEVLGTPIANRAGYLPKVGSLIEGPAFHPGVSGVNNLRALAILAGHDGPDLASQVGSLIETVGLEGRGDDRYGDYSLGMKQRLGIAAALLGDPELVILDEPTNGLDPVGMQQIRELIAAIGAEGTTVIVSSHLLVELEQVCNWLVVVDRGGLVHAGPVTDLGATDEAIVLGVPIGHRDTLEMLVERLGHELMAASHDAEVVVRLADDADPRAIAAEINGAAHTAGIVLHEVHHERADLEARYLQLVTPAVAPTPARDDRSRGRTMIAAIRSELVLLNRRRLWFVLTATMVAFVIPATWLIIATAEPMSQIGADGISLESIAGAGGATSAVVSSIGFSSILILAAFISSTASEFSRGTLRAAFARTPRRVSLLAGKVTARIGVATVMMVAALGVGWITALVVAPGQHVSTSGWTGAAAFGQSLEDLVRLIGFVFVYAVFGTLIAVLVRSTAVGLGIGLVWFGPIENVIGEGQEWADRWFPGLLLRSLLRPGSPYATATGTALATLGVYLAVAIATIGVVITRRDVTS